MTDKLEKFAEEAKADGCTVEFVGFDRKTKTDEDEKITDHLKIMKKDLFALGNIVKIYEIRQTFVIDGKTEFERLTLGEPELRKLYSKVSEILIELDRAKQQEAKNENSRNCGQNSQNTRYRQRKTD